MDERYINKNILHLQIVDVEVSAYQVSQNFSLNKRCSKIQTSKTKCYKINNIYTYIYMHQYIINTCKRMYACTYIHEHKHTNNME